jgi:hypothetical protein
MGVRFLAIPILMVCFCIIPAVEGFCIDPFEPDTVRLGEWIVDVTGPPPFHGTAVLPLVLFNDEQLYRLDMGFIWSGPILADSCEFVDERASYFQSAGCSFNNEAKNVYVFGSADEECMPAGDGDFVHLYFSVVDTGFVTVDSTSLPLERFGFRHCEGPDTWVGPQFVTTVLHIQAPPRPWGDVNGDWVVNVGDVVALVNYLYRGGSPPESLNEADVNGDCVVNVGDIVYLINYLYKNGPAPLAGCVS